MHILYLSSMFDNHTFASLFTKEMRPQHAANKYHNLLCEGLAANGVQVLAYSSLPVNNANCNKKYINVPVSRDKNLTRRYIAVINISGLKHIMLFVKSFFRSLFAQSDTVVIFDVLVISSSFGAVLGAKLRGFKLIGIVTDLPQFMPIAANPRMLKINHKLISMGDDYIFLTHQMNEKINPQNKPYIVLEGHVDIKMLQVQHKNLAEEQKRIVLYAGGLQNNYGIETLCKSFLNCARENEELHIFGDGDYASELRNLVKQNSNIVYHGNCPNSYVVEAELGATLLVNPRPIDNEFTKFSFPSKTLEYMVSGTPVLSSRLEGIPSEYSEYLYFFEDQNPNGLENALRAILDKDAHELVEKGKLAKEFALKNKNNVSQSKRIISFIESGGSGYIA